MGANSTAPHYLTPVYFDSAVLNKYYSKPEIYKVEDGIIRCGVLWSLYIDNNNLDSLEYEEQEDKIEKYDKKNED